MLPQKCQACGRYFVVGEAGVAEGRAEQLRRRGLPTLTLGDILSDGMTCACGAEVCTDVWYSFDACFVCGRTLGKHFQWQEPRWNAAGNGIALMCRMCLKEENAQVRANKRRGGSGKRQFPEWDDGGNIVIKRL